jgi:small subunit ribosomal protein S3Ae
MAKARSRAAARKVKDKWKAKTWYNVLAPASFDHVTIAETLADEPGKLIGRVTEVSLQDLTNDFRKSHIKLFFRVNSIEDSKANTEYVGHTLTSDYLRRMIRRKRSKIDAVYDVTTRDGATVRIKPFATTDRRIQNSQKRVIRETMKQTITQVAKASTLSEFVKYIIDGKIGVDIYKNCKTLYPVKRIEIFKTEVFNQPTIHIDEPKKPEPVEAIPEQPAEEEPAAEEQPETVEEESETAEESEEPGEKETEEPAEEEGITETEAEPEEKSKKE